MNLEQAQIIDLEILPILFKSVMVAFFKKNKYRVNIKKTEFSKHAKTFIIEPIEIKRGKP